MIKRFLFFLFLFTAGTFSQTLKNYPEIGYNIYFNHEDFIMGLDVQLPTTLVADKDYGALLFGVDWRPKGRRVLVQESSNLYYQYWEKQTLLYLGISEEMMFSDWLGGYGKLFTGLAFRKYRGVNNSRTGNGFQAIEGGLIFRHDNEGESGVQANIGARYFKFPETNVFPLYLLVRIALLFPY